MLFGGSFFMQLMPKIGVTYLLILVECVFCFPMSNGRVECVFSTLKLIKTDHRSNLSENHLDDQLRISVDGPPLNKWDSSGAVGLWWK